MIKFEEHEGKLFRMLEEPVPLTPDAKFPCVVRLIQDDSPMGRMNRHYKPDTELEKYAIVSRLSDSKLSIIGDKWNGYDIFNHEVIGYPVAEGSAEWACYQMMKGEKVTKGHLEHIYWHYDARPHLQCISEYNCGTLQIMVTPEIWVKTADKDGWQIYKEPKPQYKAGDFVEIRNWDSGTTHLAQIDSIDHEIHIGTLRFDISGKSVMERVPQLSIIRKLKPSEVVVEIGCLSGTVRPVSTNGTHIWFHLISAYDETIATIRISCLDTPTRSLVESLLKAQDEE